MLIQCLQQSSKVQPQPNDEEIVVMLAQYTKSLLHDKIYFRKKKLVHTTIEM